MSDKINDIDLTIKEWHDEWKRNRDFVEGARSIKGEKRRTKYLPREPGLTDAQHKSIVARTPFFPGASRAHDGLIGLIFRKPATIAAPPSAATILETITPDFLTIDDLAEEVTSEFLITNFVGLLVDQPVSSGAQSLADAEKSGARPFVAVYRAEAILGIEPGLIAGRVQIVRVRLQDDDNAIRELRLVDGRYTVTIWMRADDGSDYIAGPTITPTRNGVPINGIPFTLVSSNRRFAPAKAKLADVCDLNAQHYIASSNLAQCDFFVSHPTPYLFGPAKVAELSLAPGAFIQGEVKSGNDIRIGMLEYSGTAIDKLAARVAKLDGDMAKVSSRILAEEKASVESAETMRVRMASENAALASTARLVSRKITDALKWVAYWLGLEEGSISYEANTDYGNAALTKDEITVRASLYTSGVISKDAFLDMLIDGEVLPETFDKEADADRIAQEVADRPPVDAALPPADEDDDAA